MDIGQVFILKEKIGSIPPEEWLVVRKSGDVYALSLFQKKDRRAIGCLSEVEVEYGLDNNLIEFKEVIKFKMKKPKGLKRRK